MTAYLDQLEELWRATSPAKREAHWRNFCNVRIYPSLLNIMNEADTCREYVVPLLQAAGWENAPFSIPDSLRVPPLSDLGNVTEITERFGGADQFRAAVAKLQELLYAT